MIVHRIFDLSGAIADIRVRSHSTRKPFFPGRPTSTVVSSQAAHRLISGFPFLADLHVWRFKDVETLFESDTGPL